MPPPLDSLNSISDAQPQREPLAVIGIGCRFPGGIDSPTACWSALLAGVNAIRDVPDDRWKHALFHDTNPEKSGCIRNAKGGFIDGVDLFDGEFFGYFPTEAQRIDPQQRLLLEVTHEAMEDAGLRRDQLDGTRTSVFVGSFMYDFLCVQAASETRDEINPYVAMGTSVSSLANRISYDFNLKGPSVSLDTACSSSLVAVHLACRSLWSGDADMAIAGGVNVMLRPESSIMLSKAGFLSPDQYCKAFDAAANGYVRGEGVGVVILKPLSRAMADGDAIYACVLAAGANQDGYVPEGFTVPNVLSQIALLKAVYAEAKVDPLTVDFIEAHGTGTSVGDPIESLALGTVLGRKRPGAERCLLGSVKTNLGHLEGAAGIAGFIKGALVAHHGVAPPNLHLNNPNPDIDWDKEKLQVPTRPTPLRRDGHLWTVGVNSFGAGGTNAHVVLQEVAEAAPEKFANGRDALGATVYMLSAAHREPLRALALRHADFLSSSAHRFGDIAYSAFSRRSHYAHVLAIVSQCPKDIEDKLRKFAEGQVDPATLATKITRKKSPKLAFVFSGQGGQWARMGLELMQSEPVFRQTIEEIEVLFQELAGWSLLAELSKDEAATKIHDTVIVQPGVMAVQIALVRLYEEYGVRPQGIVGHSIGEVAAAFAAGALSLKRAVEVIYHRSQAQNLASGKGGMLAVGLALEDARKAIEPYEGRVSIGAVNGPEMLTLSGDPEPLQLIAQTLESRGVFNRPVRVQVAYHSHHMESIKEVMLTALASVNGGPATIPLYSTVTGRRENGAHLGAEYWFQNARQPVLFTDALRTMVHDGFDTFIEVGPHPVLVAGAEALFKTLDADAMIGPSMTRREPEAVVFLQSLARVAARGLELDTARLFGPERRYVRLPRYPWQHNRHWFEPPAATQLRRGRFEHPFLKRQTQLVSEPGLAVWDALLDLQKFPYLRDHQVDGEIVFPATGHLELAWAVASEQFRHETFFLEVLHFDMPLILPENSRHPLDVRLEIVSGEGDYRICSRAADAAAETPWTKHSAGRINTVHDHFPKSASSLAALQALVEDEPGETSEEFYEKLHKAGLDYGPNFRCIQKLWNKGREWLAELQLPEELVPESPRYAFHPALFDACIHAIFADAHRHGDADRIYLPHGMERVRFYRRPTQHVWAHVHITRNDEQFLCSDTAIFDENGELVAEVLGMTCKRLVGAGSRQADTLYEGCYEYQWMPAPRDDVLYGRVFDSVRAVLIGDASGIAADLAKRFAKDDIEPRIIPLGEMHRLEDLLAKVPLDRRTLIVFVAATNQGQPSWQGLGACPHVPAFLQLAQLVQRREGVPRLSLVTSGAGGVPGDEQLDLGQAILHGMTRVINNECPNIPMTVIDLSPTVTPGEIDALYHELLHIRRDRDESELALRGDQRYVRVLSPVDREAAEQAATSEEDGFGGAYRADLHDPGMLDLIVFRRLPHLALGADDVEIGVQAAALNFKDIMNAMGLLPRSAVAGGLTSHRLGLEVAGRVLRVGPNVRHVKAGDDVIARVAEGFCGRVIAPGHCVVPRPTRLTPQQAAAIPVVYITAWYSLCHLARMARGETVLLHSAAGGVGGAAIQLAQRAGAIIIATAGTNEKRDYLRQLGVEHVFDSRSLDFYNRVMEVTDGRGVDIVLNFLTGRFIQQSLRCLAPFGRFIELGKSDIYRNNKLSMERLGENISYFVVDVDRLAAQKPELHQQMMTEIVALFERGELQPGEITEFPISKLAEAMKFMTRAAYRGKIVVNMQDDRVRTLPPRQAAFRADRAYLISGGASGFGLEMARWMATRGARHFVLLSRSGPKTDEDRAAVATMKTQGADVDLAQADIADTAAVRQLLDRIKAEMPPLAGVIHGAAVMDDASLPAMNMARFEHVFRPKAQGAWNLHEATVAAGASLDFFLMLSSISSSLGFYGQVNYAAANFFEDALAHYRRQRGLPASAINLGVMGQYAGLSRAVNEEQDIIGLLDSHGLLVMPLADVLGKLEAVLIQQPVQRMTGKFDWARFRFAYPHLVRDARFVDILSDAALARGSRPKSSNLRAVLADLEPAQRRERLEQELTAKLARILDAQPEKIDVAASIDVFGLDSLMLTDLQIWIARLLDITLPLIKLLKGPSIVTLAADLLAQLDSAGSEDADGTTQESTSSATFALAEVEGVRILSPWLIRGRGDADAPARLICFHSMGVGASLFTNFLLNPPENYDILAVQTPGRENRAAEPVADSLNQLADQVVPQLLPLFDRPVVMWGHSYGGIMVREVIRRLRERGCEPVHFVVTGTIAPHLIDRWQHREVILKSMVVDNSAEYLISLSRYVDDLDLIKAILPGMRRDYPLLRSYRYQAMAPLNCPITAFAARQDDVVYVDEIEAWSQHTRGGFELIEVDGDHWFVNRNRALITATLEDIAARRERQEVVHLAFDAKE
jgi:acyl transferase domain-containing protein/NADPH:quinone reductase-like Zn-dependent oxidoreductase/surfactin synthase thioesterase subunit/NAD(P)-dependent dehydrogenase (short-subunit alcohol dehydrogenase family)